MIRLNSGKGKASRRRTAVEEMEEEEGEMEKEESEGMGCAPVMTKINVSNLLDPTDSHLDLLLQEYIAVPRCREPHAFCGRLGLVEGRCRPHTTQNMTFALRLNTHGPPLLVQYEAHLECRCDAVV
ncbi:hypothetical protein GWK47_051961 [Chionoecetes opilio]|uniref:Uncharacterized protein n=1 Tax=Chionoecetes opilio TaxID=41210 RepID=A0A8J5CQD5_CHIOP|nr:hypothetical protein GWK47_051961 [Chionoecetes opilio]